MKPQKGKKLEKLREEAYAMERLSHQHILKLIGTYTYNKFLYLMLYPVAVCDLSSFLKEIEKRNHTDLEGMEKGLMDLLGLKTVGTTEDLAPSRTSVHTITSSASTMTAVRFLQQTFGCMTEALAYIHKMGIRHCDLKPGNILLSPGRVYLADFGVARDVSAADHSITSRCELQNSPFSLLTVHQMRDVEARDGWRPKSTDRRLITNHPQISGLSVVCSLMLRPYSTVNL